MEKKTTATLKKQHPTSSIVLDDKKTFFYTRSYTIIYRLVRYFFP